MISHGILIVFVKKKIKDGNLTKMQTLDPSLLTLTHISERENEGVRESDGRIE